MIERTASLLVCDDVRLEVSGKLMLIGVYTADVVIPFDEFIAPQMHFLFYAECARADPFQSLKCEISLPGNPAIVQTADIGPPLPEEFFPERDRMFIRQQISIAAVTLRPGKISAKVIHERGEIDLRGGWILKMDRSPSPVPGEAAPPKS